MSKEFPAERLLIKVINDLADFLPYLVLVGGWVPYIYAKYIWPYRLDGDSPDSVSALCDFIPVITTTDVDFGISVTAYSGKESIAEHIRKLGYGERHVSMDRIIPFVPVVKDEAGEMKAEVEFISDPESPKRIVNKIVGREIKVNEIRNFNLLIDSTITVSMYGQNVQIPAEAKFAFHKLLTFVDRQNDEKLKKDLYYVYYMLRFCPERELLADNIVRLIKERKEGSQVKANLKKYFSSIDAKGPLFVERENGPDSYVDDVRQDVFDRFSGILRKVLSH